MSDFILGVIFAAIILAPVRVFFGRFTVWESGRGWVLRFETTDARTMAIFQQAVQENRDE